MSRGRRSLTSPARTFVAVVGLLLLPACGGGSSSGSPTSGAEPAVVWRDIRVDNVGRRYRLYTPPEVGDSRKVPLVLALHGSLNSVQSFVDASELDDTASANGFVVAYPEALGLVWNGGFCCTSGRGDPAADLRFLDQVISDVAGVRDIDVARVYAVGMSGGGVMAYRLACGLTERLAGAASVAGAMLLDDCQPSRPISVLAIHGTADGIVPYEGGRIQGGAVAPAPPAPAIAARWAASNRCSEPQSADVDGLVRRATWSGCDRGTRVRLVTVEGGGHNWFATIYGPPNGAVDANRAIVEFFDLGRR